MNKRLAVLCLIVALDAIGVGIIYPVLPELLRTVTRTAALPVAYGAILALHAFMQFVFSPALGALSDRFGRRPVILVSLAGATIDYAVMSGSSSITALLIGRAIAGVTSASLAVAMAYVADVTEERDRSARIGFLQAAFGIGIFFGPILGGSLGAFSLRLPFLGAAVLGGVTFTFTYFSLPESRRGSGTLTVAALNPFGSLRRAAGIAALLPLLGVHVVMGVIGNLQSTIWVLYGHDRFQWDSQTIGYSLALLGLCHALSQALLIGPVTRLLGDRNAVYAGIAFDMIAMLSISVATRGWMAFALAPVFSLGAIGLPALQSLTSRQVDDAHQGELQGVLASIGSLTAIVGPLVAATASHGGFGVLWIGGAALYVLCVPLLPRNISGRSEAALNA